MITSRVILEKVKSFLVMIKKGIDMDKKKKKI